MTTEKQGALLRGLARDVHDLCQPLTALQCRLELGLISGGDAAMREAVEGGLIEMVRVFTCLSAIRGRLLDEGSGGAYEECGAGGETGASEGTPMAKQAGVTEEENVFSPWA